MAEVNVATVDIEEKETKTMPRAGERGPQKSLDALVCTPHGCAKLLETRL